MTITELVGGLNDTWEALERIGSAIDASGWAAPTECPGWRVRDVYLHLLAVERVMRGQSPAPGDASVHEPNDRQDAGLANVDDINRVAFAARREWSGPRVFAEFAETISARRRDLADLDDRDESSASLLQLRVFDTWVHEQDVRHALNLPWRLAGPAADVGLAVTRGVLPYQVAKRGAAPDGTVVFVLDDPDVPDVAIEIRNGRGRLANDHPMAADGATFRIRLAPPDLLRLAWGRAHFDPTRPGSVRIETGDEAIAGNVLQNLRFVP